LSHERQRGRYEDKSEETFEDVRRSHTTCF
jgi:hypothetical protein